MRDEYYYDIELLVLMIVEKLDVGCLLEERFEVLIDVMCLILDDELIENYKLLNFESCNKEKFENNELNKENSFYYENFLVNKVFE